MRVAQKDKTHTHTMIEEKEKLYTFFNAYESPAHVIVFDEKFLCCLKEIVERAKKKENKLPKRS